MFELKSAVHRLQLNDIERKLLADPNFLRAFPELKEIAEIPDRAVHLGLRHDFPKNEMPASHPIKKVLARSNGLSYRDLPPVDYQRTAMERGIGAMNANEYKSWGKGLRRLPVSSRAKTAYNNFILAIDYHTVPMARKAEFGGDVRSASEWALKMIEEGKIDKRNGMEVYRYAKGFEDTFDPTETLRRYNIAEVKKHGFGKLAKEMREETRAATRMLKAAANNAQMRVGPIALATTNAASGAAGATALRVTGKIAKAAGSMVVFAAGIEAGQYVMSSDPKAQENALAGFTGSKSVSDCQTQACKRFLAECAEAKKELSICVREDFFEKYPVHEQTLRRRDADLDGLLSRFAGRILSVRCESDAGGSPVRVVKMKVKDRYGKIQSQKVEYGEKNKTERIAIENGDQPTVVLFGGGEPDRLKYWVTRENLVTQKTESLYATVAAKSWRKKELSPFIRATHAIGETQTRAIQKAQDAVEILQTQHANLANCCASKECRDSYATLPESVEEFSINENAKAIGQNAVR